MSLYLKYRPKDLLDVVGQDHIVETFQNAQKQDKFAHAYLFTGTRGTGKTSTARIVAKVLMTRGIEDEAIKKQVMKGIEEGSLVDLLEIDGASNRGIDDIRELIEKIQFSPVVASAKVYIIDEVHMLTKEAFNALLKTLEEPPAYAYFILATTEVHKVPATIQSRCQCFPFHRISVDDIIRRLQYIADQERIDVEREALRAIAKHCQGGMRDAISLLDQLRSLPKITLADVEQRIGGTNIEAVHDVLQAVSSGNQQGVLEAVRAIESTGIAMDVFLRQILEIMREDMHTAIAEGQSTAPYVRVLETLLEALRNVRTASVPGLVVEAALLSLCSSDTETVAAIPSVKAPVPTKEPEPSTPELTKESPKKEESTVEPKQEATTEDATIEAPSFSLDQVKAAWPNILKNVDSAAIKMSLKNATVDTVRDQKLVLAFTSAFHKDKIADTTISRSIETLLEQHFKTNVQLECTVQEAGTSGSTSEDSDMVNLAQAASEIF